MGGDAHDRDMTLRALLAADCGSGVGLGHLERMLALADALRPDVDLALVMPDDGGALRRRVEARGHTVVTAPGSAARRVEDAVAATPAVDVVVLDGYIFGSDLQSRLRRHARLAVVDDLGLPASCDLAVNPSPGGELLRPTGATTFLGGAPYALVRASFSEAHAAVLRLGRPPRSVLVSTGSIDLEGIAERVSAELLEEDGTIEVVRVVGPDSRTTTSPYQPRLHLLVAPPSLAEALMQSTVYVGAAGTTAVQAACVGIPAVITAAVSNQSAQADALAAAGCALVVEADALVMECLRLLDDPDRCALMAARGPVLIDGRGASRVADALRELTRGEAA